MARCKYSLFWRGENIRYVLARCKHSQFWPGANIHCSGLCKYSLCSGQMQIIAIFFPGANIRYFLARCKYSLFWPGANIRCSGQVQIFAVLARSNICCSSKVQIFTVLARSNIRCSSQVQIFAVLARCKYSRCSGPVQRLSWSGWERQAWPQANKGMNNLYILYPRATLSRKKI